MTRCSELDEINRDSPRPTLLRHRRQRRHQPGGEDRSVVAIYGMPILDVEKAKKVLFVKRSMASGYAGVENRAVLPRQHNDAVSATPRRCVRRSSRRSKGRSASAPSWFWRRRVLYQSVHPKEEGAMSLRINSEAPTSRRRRRRASSAFTTGSAMAGHSCSRTRRTSRRCAPPSSAIWRA